eukprot:scaffold15034_cov181-Amphora_coffeaeformis.AAC.4
MAFKHAYIWEWYEKTHRKGLLFYCGQIDKYKNPTSRIARQRRRGGPNVLDSTAWSVTTIDPCPSYRTFFYVRAGATTESSSRRRRRFGSRYSGDKTTSGCALITQFPGEHITLLKTPCPAYPVPRD